MPKKNPKPKPTELQPHQKRVLKKLKDNDKVLVYHGLGSGKTLTALSAAAQSGKPASVIGPAALRGNFQKEKKKHNVDADVDYSSYAKPEPKSEDMLVFDEAHRMGRQESQRSKYPQKYKSKKTLMLTGTPIRNEPSELIPLLKGLDVDVPNSRREFYNKYVDEKKVSPGLMARLRGIKPGVKKDGKNIHELAEKLKGKVDYHKNPKENYPEVDEKVVKVPMSDRQRETYDMALSENPTLAYKVKHGIPPSKKESGRMNAFLTATRQISNTPKPYNLSSKAVDDSPKMQRVLQDIDESYKNDKNYKGVTYSNYLSSGIEPIAAKLKEKDIPYATFSGATPKKKRKEIVNKYNKGEIKHLLISGAGSEGLDLKGTKMLQIMEPHWNKARIDQVKGRPIRYKSHADLPKEERNIKVRKYHSVYPGEKQKSTDQYLAQLSKEKEDLNKDFKNALILGSALGYEKPDKDVWKDVDVKDPEEFLKESNNKQSNNTNTMSKEQVRSYIEKQASLQLNDIEDAVGTFFDDKYEKGVRREIQKQEEKRFPLRHPVLTGIPTLGIAPAISKMQAKDEIIRNMARQYPEIRNKVIENRERARQRRHEIAKARAGAARVTNTNTSNVYGGPNEEDDPRLDSNPNG